MLFQLQILSIQTNVTIHWPTWILLIPTLIAVALIVVALIAFVKGPHPLVGWFVLCVAFVPGAIFAPSMYFDQVVISSNKIEQTTGFFLLPTVKGFRYEAVEFIRIKSVIGRRNRISAIWEIHNKSGAISEIDPGDLWENNTQEIVKLLDQNGVSFR